MKKDNNINLFAFWEYDTYPYMLGGKASKMNDKGYVYVDSYQSWFNPFKLMPVAVGKKLYAEVENLRASYREADIQLKKEYVDKLFGVVPYHPKNKIIRQ